jgi:hypothetical protein
MHNIVNKILTKNFPNLEKSMPIHMQETSRASTDLNKIEISHKILSLKQQVQRLEKEY